MRFWNRLHQVCSKSKYLKAKWLYYNWEQKTPKGLNKDSQIDETTYARMRWTSVLIIVICNFGCYFPEYSESLFLPLVTMVELLPDKVSSKPDWIIFHSMVKLLLLIRSSLMCINRNRNILYSGKEWRLIFKKKGNRNPLDCPLLIVLSVFSNVYFIINRWT